MSNTKFSEQGTVEQLEEFLNGKEYRHNYYFHYTSLYAINKILESKSLKISCVNAYNDEVDKKQFSDDERHKYFGFCFSTGINENLPLWYLYGSNKGNGGRIRFTKAQVRNLIEHGTYTLTNKDVNEDDNEKDKKKDENEKKEVVLERGKSMTVTFQDVLYFKYGDKMQLKYNNSTNYLIPKEEFEKYKQNHQGFCKGLIWFFEKETRLLVKITDEVARIFDKDERIFVRLSIPDKVLDSMTITLCPQITDEEEIDKNNDKIIEFVKRIQRKKSPLTLSEYKGTIKINLCKDCNRIRKLKRISKSFLGSLHNCPLLHKITT